MAVLFIEQPLALPGSAKYSFVKKTKNYILNPFKRFEEEEEKANERKGSL